MAQRLERRLRDHGTRTSLVNALAEALPFADAKVFSVSDALYVSNVYVGAGRDRHRPAGRWRSSGAGSPT